MYIFKDFYINIKQMCAYKICMYLNRQLFLFFLIYIINFFGRDIKMIKIY